MTTKYSFVFERGKVAAFVILLIGALLIANALGSPAVFLMFLLMLGIFLFVKVEK